MVTDPVCSRFVQLSFDGMGRLENRIDLDWRQPLGRASPASRELSCLAKNVAGRDALAHAVDVYIGESASLCEERR